MNFVSLESECFPRLRIGKHSDSQEKQIHCSLRSLSVKCYTANKVTFNLDTRSYKVGKDNLLVARQALQRLITDSSKELIHA